MNKIAEEILNSSRKNGGAFIPYVMAGDPTPEMSVKYIRALDEAGADVIELGVPFSDPVADGPTIQAAGTRALDSIGEPGEVLNLVREVREEIEAPIILMSYYNPILQFGEKKFLDKCTETGVNGLILPDLPVGEAEKFLEQAEDRSVEIPMLATPATSKERLTRIAEKSSGFLYLVARPGTTGASSEVEEGTTVSISSITSQTPSDLPICVGFGLSTPDQIAEVITAGADGAIVGSAIVDRIGRGHEPERIKRFVVELKSGTEV